MKIGIVGAGRVGTSVGKYITEYSAQHSLSGFYSRTYSNTVKSADFCSTKAFKSLSDLIASSDTFFIAVSDKEIGNVWECIDKALIKNKIIGHFSGSLSSDVFTGANDYGAYTGSIHPVYAFSNKFESYKNLNQAVFTAEGDAVFLSEVKGFFENLGNRVCVIDKTKKPLYHTSVSMASNHLMGLLFSVVNMLKSCGFSEADAYTVLTPLMSNNLNNALENGVSQALTGPIERGDVSTIEKHLGVLSGEYEEIYKLLGNQVLKIAENKNSGNQQLLEEYRCIERMLLK